MPEALKAAWEVRAGVIPGTAIPKLTKRYFYTSTDYDQDGQHNSDFGYHPIFMKKMAEAASYHMQMSNPRANNWAELSFVWY